MPVSLSRKLARFANDLTFDDLPPEVVDKIQALVLQALVSALAGSRHSAAKRIVQMIRREESGERSREGGGSTILVDGGRVTKAGAAFANSELIHRGGRLDLYRMLTHPGTTIIPAALVAAEAEGRSGRELITALAAGYEVPARMAGEWIPSTQARGFRSSPVYGIFGATVAAGKLMGLDEDGLTSAIGIAVDLAAGNLEGPRTGSDSVSIHEPSAARSAILAVLLAREGTRGSETALEGEAGFYHAYAGSNRGRLSYGFQGRKTASYSTVTSGLGRRWEILNTALRIYAVGGSNLALIDVGAKLCIDNDIRFEDVLEVEAVVNEMETTYPSAAFPSAKSGPRVGSQHYYLAYGIVERGFPMSRGRADGAAEPADPPAVLALMQRVRIVPSRSRPVITPRITIRTRGGATFTATATGREFMFGLRDEIDRISVLAPDLPIAKARFDEIVSAVRDLPGLDRASRLIELTFLDAAPAAVSEEAHRTAT
jgi:2-methylcitrate dehydratase PrpD